MNNNAKTSLRGFWRMLAGIGVLATVAGFQSTTSFANDGWKVEWEKVLAAARKEGVVVVSGPPGAFQRRAITEGWARWFPDIRLEYTGGRGRDVVSKVVRERTAGIYNFDIILASTSPTVFALVPINALAPLRDAIIMPDIVDDKTWYDSFEAGFMDKEKRYFFNPMGTGGQGVGFVNRDCISREVFSEMADLVKPQLKGKLVWYDPTGPGTASRSTWLISMVMGEDWLKNVFQNHGVIFARSYRQMTDWLVSCKVYFAFGMTNDVLEQMQKQGIGTRVEDLVGPAYTGKINPGGAGGNESIGWYNNAPHPNAAKVFVNWFLSRDFQQFYADIVKDNSRRVDVKPGDPKHVMEKGKEYFSWSTEEATVRVKALQDQIKAWGVIKNKKKKK